MPEMSREQSAMSEMRGSTHDWAGMRESTPQLAREDKEQPRWTRTEEEHPCLARDDQDTPCPAREGRGTSRLARGGGDDWIEEDRSDREHSLRRSRSLRDRKSTHHGSLGQPKATFLRSHSHRAPQGINPLLRRYLEEDVGRIEEQPLDHLNGRL